MRKASKVVLTVIILLISAPLAIIYLNINPLFLSWIYAWLFLWGYFLLGSSSIDQKALGFLFGSVILGVVGPKFMSGETVQAFMVETIAQVMIVMGGGIGASIMASYIYAREKK